MVRYTENMNKEVPLLRERIKAALEEHGLKHSWLTKELQRRVDPKISHHAVEKAIGGRISGRTYEILVASVEVIKTYEEVYLSYAKRENALQG